MSFKKTSFEGDFCSKAVVAQEISPKISTNNMREVKIEFQENNNGLRFSRRPSLLMGIFFLWVSFPNDRFIIISK